MPKDAKKISVVVGEPLAEDIYSMDRSVVLCRKGTIVTKKLIQQLSNWIVEEEPRVEGEKPPKSPVKRQLRAEIIKKLEFQEIVSEKTRAQLEDSARGFFEKIGTSGAKLDMSGIDESIASLVNETPENPDVPLKLFQLKKHVSYMYEHSLECAIIASFVATNLNYPPHEVSAFVEAMMLHDTGILSTPEEALNKTTLLTDNEWEEIRKHCINGWDTLKKVPGVDPLTLIIALGHHVNADGTGYPDNVDFNDLPPLAHLAVVINHFEALTAERPYRRPFSLHEAVSIMLGQKEKYHPAAIENFVRVVGIYPISTFLMLNTGEIGVVVRNNPENLFLPEIKLVLDPAGKQYSKDVIVNLINEKRRSVVRVVDNV